MLVVDSLFLMMDSVLDKKVFVLLQLDLVVLLVQQGLLTVVLFLVLDLPVVGLMFFLVLDL